LDDVATEGEGEGDGSPEGSSEGEGPAEGEGVAEGEGGGVIEGEGEGVIEGEGMTEGEGEGEGGAPAPHSADLNGDGVINLSELLRVIQFYNMGGYQCVIPPATSEDGYLPGSGDDYACPPHASDYHPQDWQINLSEILRLIQFFNMSAYHACPGLDTEDGYCPGPA
jgi:hypothetical protein